MKSKHSPESALALPSNGEGGFLNLCIFLGLFVFFVGILVGPKQCSIGLIVSTTLTRFQYKMFTHRRKQGESEH